MRFGWQLVAATGRGFRSPAAPSTTSTASTTSAAVKELNVFEHHLQLVALLAALLVLLGIEA